MATHYRAVPMATYLVIASCTGTAPPQPTLAPVAAKEPSVPPASAATAPPQIQASAPLVSARLLDGLSTNQLLGWYFYFLGPAHSDPCSGMYCWEWRFTDGRRLFISTGQNDQFHVPMYVKVLAPGE